MPGLAACGGGGALSMKPAAKHALTPDSIQRMLSSMKLRAIYDKKNGVLYRADGTQEVTRHVKMIPDSNADCLGINIAPGCSTTYGSGGYASGDYPIIGYVSVNINYTSQTIAYNNFGNSFGFTNTPGCVGAAAAIPGQAWAAAIWVAQNLSGSIAQAAQTAISQWQGTTMGVAAAAEFIAFLFTALTLPELAMLAADGIVLAALVYALVNC